MWVSKKGLKVERVSMAGSSMGDDEEITAINVTPLVDVVLVLLVIFMVTASYIVHRSIQVKLPDAVTGEVGVKPKSLAFILDKEANLYLDGEKITYSELPGLIEKAGNAKSLSKLQAVISADKAVSHGAVMKLIDTVRKLGISDFAVDVETAALP